MNVTQKFAKPYRRKLDLANGRVDLSHGSGGRAMAQLIADIDSDKAPCACFADGIALATVATLGARTMRLAPEKAPDGAMAVVVVRNKRTGAAVKYTVADTWIPKLAEWNRTLEPRARYDEVMKADNLFEAAVEN